MRELVRHAMKVVPAPPNINVHTVNDLEDPEALVDGDQMLQVLTNLISNAFCFVFYFGVS